MKAIVVREENLAEISPEVTKKYLKWLKAWASISKHAGTPVFFIPWYEFPLTAGIPRDFVVSQEYMRKYFSPVGFYPDSYWMRITPKQLT